MKRYVYIFGIIVGIVVVGSQRSQGSELISQKDKRAVYIKQRRVGDLQVGDEAPDFTLEAADGSKTVQLASFEGNREVVLIFGSYT